MDKYNTEHYTVIVAELSTDGLGYQIVNKLTGVVEYEDVILPRTLDSLASLQQELTRANEEIAPATRPKLASIGGDKPNGDGSIH